MPNDHHLKPININVYDLRKNRSTDDNLEEFSDNLKHYSERLIVFLGAGASVGALGTIEDKSLPTALILRNEIWEHFMVSKGETFDLGQVPVTAGKMIRMNSVMVGNEMAVFIDGTSELKIFYKGKIIETGVLNPMMVRMKDNMLVFEDGSGGFSVFYNGKISHLENFIPSKIELSQSSMYYFTQTNEIRFFTFGNTIELPIQIYDDIRLDYDVLQVKTGFNSFNFYYKDKKL